MPKHIAVYVRVSTRQQDTKSQEPELQRWIAAYAGEQPVRWYRDKASGKTMERPAWAKLEAALDAGEVASIVVLRLDRLGRTASGLTKLFDKLIASKVGLVSLKDGIDLSTTAGRLVANVMASVAAYETEVRGERTVQGQILARQAGKRWGGSKKGRLLTITQDQVNEIRRLNAEGTQVSRIARTVGVTRQSVYRILEARPNGYEVAQCTNGDSTGVR